MEMSLDITAHHAPQRSHELVDLPRVRAPNGIRHSDPVDADFVDRSVQVQKVDQVGSERVFGGESDFDPFGLDKVDDYQKKKK